MAINVGNLDNVEVKQPTGGVMPVGDYYGFVEEAEETQSKSGNEMIKLQIVTTANGKYDGKKLWYYLIFGKEWSLEQLKKAATCMNIPTQGLTVVSAEMFVGKACKFRVKHDTWEGETQAKIHFFLPLDKEIAVPDAAPIDDDSEIPF